MTARLIGVEKQLVSKLLEMKEPLFSLADTLAMDLKVKGSTEHQASFQKIYGSSNRYLRWLEGRNTTLKISPKIMDSVIDVDNKIYAVVVHVSGSLFLFVLHDDSRNTVTMMVINGIKVGWTSTKVRLFNKSWSRKNVYAKLVDGVQAVFLRSVFETKWTLYEKGRMLIKDYLKLRNEGVGSSKALEEVIAEHA